MPSVPSSSADATFPSPAAAFLSYLVPGLGQISQGRLGKGFLFLISIYGLFFYGMALGHWKNVYLLNPDETGDPKKRPGLASNLYNRPQFVGQFWVGVAAWPALWQYVNFESARNDNPPLGGFQRTPRESEINELQIQGDKTWDLGWVYTVIAGVLNVLIIYDAYAGPAILSAVDPLRDARRVAPARGSIS